MMQNKLFIKHPFAIVPVNNTHSALLKESADIVNQAMKEHDPYAICLMLSGGDDSITSLAVAKKLGIKIDFIIHGVTGTGLPAVKEFVIKTAKAAGIPLLLADAGKAYEEYVLRKGFFGKGNTAHSFAYHILKQNPFDTTISKHIRQGKIGRRILLLNGVRVEESDNRADNYGDNPYRKLNNDYWVNIIHWWTKKECLEFLEAEAIARSPVSIALGRSGECNCGTMQSDADRMEAAKFDPEWGIWMAELRTKVVKKFGWDINQAPNKKVLDEIKAITQDLLDFRPMCVGCKSTNGKLF